MNKKILSLSAISLTSFLLAGCTFPGITSTTSQVPAQTMTEAAKFAAAIQSGKPTICTMSKGTELSMEYFIKGKTMRVNTTNKVVDNSGKEKTTIAHMINDGQLFYMWTDNEKQGTKITIPSPNPSAIPTETTTKNTTPNLESEADYQKFQDQGYSINCRAENVDETIFTPPSDVKFIDPSEIMKQVTVPGKVPSREDIQKLQQQYAGSY